jgi:dsRNA-specific ribonuclease
LLKDYENNDEDDYDGNEETIDDYDTPKFLADIFESVAGAIFLDSGCSLSTVWNVYYKMFDPYFSKFFLIIVDLVKYTNSSFFL